MNKKELVDAVSDVIGIRKSDVSSVMEGIIDTVLNQLVGGDKVNISGLGSFYVVERGARMGRNPKTGEEVEVPAKKVAKFKPAAAMKNLFM